MKKAKNVGMLVFPVIWCEDFSRYNDIAHGVFFENTTEGFDYMEEMNEKNDGSVYYYWSNLLMEYKKSNLNQNDNELDSERRNYEFNERES